MDAETGIAELEPDILEEAREMFELCENAESENRTLEREDLRFIDLKEQWPIQVVNQRRLEGRPCLVIDKLSPVVRQVLNDARMNKPQIKVKPVDSNADPETAEIIGGLIRNIEYSSNADVAYDTALAFAVKCGRGYFRVNAKYATDDTFDQDLVIERIPDPMMVWGDPYSSAADSSDWNYAFVTEMLSKKQFELRFPKADKVNWDDYADLSQPWLSGDEVMVAEYWKREEIESYAALLSNGETVKFAEAPEVQQIVGFEDEFQMVPVTVLAVRPIKTYKVTQYLLSGKELLSTTEWPGQYIPIIPVYGDEIVVDGKRRFVSLIRPAMDAQRMYNYFRSTSAEMAALAPKSPFIGPEEAFKGDDAHKWETANTTAWSYLSYKGQTPPQRQGYVGASVADMQEALNSSDDIKAITGVHDASLGARSNETSGRAIMARQREGDVSTFNFIDNLHRAINHCGRILVDLIPFFYSQERVIRVLNPKMEPETVKIGPPEMAQQPQSQMDSEMQEIDRIYSLGVGKYDVAVATGASFTTQREESAAFLTELLRAAPQYADLIGPLLLKLYDDPAADELVEEIKKRQEQQGQMSPEDQAKMQESMLKAQQAQADIALEQEKIATDRYKAETERIKVLHEIQQPPRYVEMNA